MKYLTMIAMLFITSCSEKENLVDCKFTRKIELLGFIPVMISETALTKERCAEYVQTNQQEEK